MTTTSPANDEPSSRSAALTRVADAYSVAIDKAASTKDGIVSAVEGNPLVTLLAGLAIGAAAGALLPRSAREKAMLAPLGEKLAAAAEAALDAGREAGSKALSDSDLSVDGLREQVSKLIGQATEAAGAAGSAAIEAARESVQD